MDRISSSLSRIARTVRKMDYKNNGYYECVDRKMTARSKMLMKNMGLVLRLKSTNLIRHVKM